MHYIFVKTTDELLSQMYYGFDQASRDAFEGDDNQRFEAILFAHEFRKQLLGRMKELKESDKASIVDPKLIDPQVADQSLIERLSALMLDKPGLRSFISQNQDKLCKKLNCFLKDILQSTQENEHVLFWMVSEEELNELL